MTCKQIHFIMFCVLLCFVFSDVIAQVNMKAYEDYITKRGKKITENVINGEDNIESVKKNYESVLQNDSTNYDALTNMGVIYFQSGEIDKSLYYFERAVRYNPQKARAYHNLGILNSIKGRIDLTIAYLKKAAELDSTNPNSIRQLGIIYLQNKMPIQAIVAFNSALNRDKFDIESRLGKALAYWSLKSYDKVLSEIIKMQSFGLRFRRMELLLADVYFKKKDYEKAIRYAKIDKEENSDQAEGHYLLGQLYKIKNEKDKSEFEFEEVTEIMLQNPKASLGLTINIFFDATLK